MKLSENDIRKVVIDALVEDRAQTDITTQLIDISKAVSKANIISRQKGVLCGVGLLKEVFRELDRDVEVEALKRDGDPIDNGEVIIKLRGASDAILKGERTALNFLSHLSGVSSLTRKYVDLVKGVNQDCDVLDTRKTLPGLRKLQKYAVYVGGGMNHRLDLSDQILVKENHIRASGIKLEKLVQKIQDNKEGNIKVEIEVENIDELKTILPYNVDIIMLDNFTLEDIKEAIILIRESSMRTKIEVSGGVNIDNIGSIASLGVDRISIGRLTSSLEAVDFSMLFEEE